MQSGQAGDAPGFGSCDVCQFVHEQVAAALVVCHGGDGIALRATGDKEGGFLAGELRGQCLQRFDGGIALQCVVAKRSPAHGLPHGIGGLGDGVAA